MNFYLWDVLNPDNITEGIAKPHLKERGPYAYREVRKKVYTVLFQVGLGSRHSGLRGYFTTQKYPAEEQPMELVHAKAQFFSSISRSK